MLPPETALAAVLDRIPDLTVEGICGKLRPHFEQRRADLLHPDVIEEFRLAAAWLSHVPKVKQGGEDSYLLKHVVEDWASRYVSNGAMIAAACHMQFRVEAQASRINARIGIACGRHWPLRPGSRQFEWVQRRYPGNKKIIPPPALGAV